VVSVEGSSITYRTTELHRINESLCMLRKKIYSCFPYCKRVQRSQLHCSQHTQVR